MPLLIQIDTFDENQPDEPIHRGACQIKVFCDKGAERKIRDEERKALRKRQKCGTYTMLQPQDVKGPIMSTGRKHDIVYYKTMLDTSINPVYFQPEISNSAVETLVYKNEISRINNSLSHFSTHEILHFPSPKQKPLRSSALFLNSLPSQTKPSTPPLARRDPGVSTTLAVHLESLSLLLQD